MQESSVKKEIIMRHFSYARKFGNNFFKDSGKIVRRLKKVSAHLKRGEEPFK